MPSLNFKGKALVQNFHLLVPYSELKPVKSKSLTDKVSLHDTMIAMEQADVSFRLMMQVRNKIVEAYQEILRMQV